MENLLGNLQKHHVVKSSSSSNQGRLQQNSRVKFTDGDEPAIAAFSLRIEDSTTNLRFASQVVTSWSAIHDSSWAMY